MSNLDLYMNLHDSYEHKVLVINSYFANEIAYADSDSRKESLIVSSRNFYKAIGDFTTKLNSEDNIDKKLLIAKERDTYLNNIIGNYSIDIIDEEKNKSQNNR